MLKHGIIMIHFTSMVNNNVSVSKVLRFKVCMHAYINNKRMAMKIAFWKNTRNVLSEKCNKMNNGNSKFQTRTKICINLQ